MPVLKTDRLPKYRKHKASGQAIVTLAGKDHYLGPHGTQTSKLEFDRLVAQWLADGRPTREQQARAITVTQLLCLFWDYAQKYYVKNGKTTSTPSNYKIAIKVLRAEYGDLKVGDLGPLAITRLQHLMVEQGYARRYINETTSKIKRIVKWGVSKELVDVTIYQAILTVEGLQKNRTTAREPKKVRPVSDLIVDATVEHLPQVVADMVRLQRLTGARPGEIRLLKKQQVHKSLQTLEEVLDPDFAFNWVDGIWIYLPGTHKTEHHDCSRIIPIGPKAQLILAPYLEGIEDGDYCFSPTRSEEQRRQLVEADRKTPPRHGNYRGKKRKKPLKPNPRKPRDHYSKDSFGKAIKRACMKAFPIPSDLSEAEVEKWKQKYFWAPNRLRHTAGTEIRKNFGLEEAQAILGHARVTTTQIYAEKNIKKAIDVIQQIG